MHDLELIQNTIIEALKISAASLKEKSSQCIDRPDLLDSIVKCQYLLKEIIQTANAKKE